MDSLGAVTVTIPNPVVVVEVYRVSKSVMVSVVVAVTMAVTSIVWMTVCVTLVVAVASKTSVVENASVLTA